MLQNNLSPLYRRLLPENLLTVSIPKERFADCNNCQHSNSEKSIRHHTKCCDFHPRLPNYIVGGLLSDETTDMAEGRKRIVKKIQNQKGVTPYGIIAPLAYYQKNASLSFSCRAKIDIICFTANALSIIQNTTPKS